MANCFIRCCRVVKHLPVRVICILVFILHTSVVDYYLVEHKGNTLLWFLVADIVIFCLFVASFIVSFQSIRQPNTDSTMEKVAGWLGVASWSIYAVIVASKSGIIFIDFADDLDESNFFGPNTLKTALALTGVVFLLQISSLHDAKPGSERRAYIDELAGTVIFDVMDCVDSMEPLFIKEDRESFPPGLVEAIVAIACLNFVIPTIPLLTLSHSKFGHAMLPRRLVMIHKILLAYIINLPLLTMRMILWHGLNHGVSIFSLKNVIVIGVITYDFYEHHEADMDEPDKPNQVKKAEETFSGEEYSLENRFNYE
ncbi:uncharacterized protein LOC125681869 [Ostrea edulis]|uniref:uncharacterized protein LOC125681869 n=1 Tax=Ostrea edulis TaxID=37623 RepID=UPI002094C157|nr:uncharacterized protein LOC125681869 [Ostrea edulis]XP_056012356.1 uncharacterized protein LOC125681869 [Ostrea edulis]